MCPILCDPMDCSPPGSSVHGILQARILEWVAISFCKGSSQPRDRTRVSCIAGRRFILWATREAPKQKILNWVQKKIYRFHINSPNPWTQNIFPFIWVFFNFLHWCITVLITQSFTSLVKFISKYFILFDVLVEGIICIFLFFT